MNSIVPCGFRESSVYVRDGKTIRIAAESKSAAKSGRDHARSVNTPVCVSLHLHSAIDSCILKTGLRSLMSR